MSKTFAWRSATLLTALFVISCTGDTPAVDSIAGPDNQPPRLSASQLADANGVIVFLNGMNADGSVPADVAAEAARQGAEVLSVDGSEKMVVLQGLKDEAAMRKLGSVNTVTANPELQMHTDQSSAVFYAAQQQNLPAIRANQAWLTAFSGGGARVCIIDSGIDKTHPDLVGKVALDTNVLAGADGLLAAQADGNGHGTHVGSTVSSNGIGIGSVASDATLLNARVFNSAGGGATTAVILSAIAWCGRNNAHVINMSIGFGDGLLLGNPIIAQFQASIDAARALGMVVVASAGNSNLRFPSAFAMAVPAGLNGVIAVGATARGTNTRARYSNRGSFVDLWAPGSNILAVCSTFSSCLGGLIRQHPGTPGNPGRYMEISGTSMASPHVAGVAAITYGRFGVRNAANRAAVEACLLNTARITNQVQILPDPFGSRVDALLASQAIECGGAPPT